MATLSMFIALRVSIPLGAISLAGVSVSGMDTALTKKYQKKVAKATELVNIITLALVVFETSISEVSGRVDKQEFTTLETFHLGVLSELGNFDCKMEVETKTELHKSTGRDHDLKKA